MTVHWTTDIPGVGCDPVWSSDYQPTDRTPTRLDLRHHEMHDLRNQGAGPRELWTAHDVPVGSYL